MSAWAAEQLGAASGGKLTGNIKSITELNLKGTEVLRLLKSGVYDVAHALPIYVDDGAAIFEGSDLSVSDRPLTACGPAGTGC